MSWLQQLCLTYDENVEKSAEEDSVLPPISHMLCHAQIEISLNERGEFQHADIVDSKKDIIIIPVSEVSAGRTSQGEAPHILSDELSYIAGDYCDYVQDEEEKKKLNKKFDVYLSGLRHWLDSPFSHLKVKAIYDYVSKRNMIKDLILSDIVKINENGFLQNKKINGRDYKKSIVRFRVYQTTSDIDSTWEDYTLVDSYIKYYSMNNKQLDICYATGKFEPISLNHPSGIMGKAKLVTSNENGRITFGGRFQSAEQAYALGYEASQKAHNALSWMAKRQGVSVGSTTKRSFVCWNPLDKSVPNILDPLHIEEDEFDLFFSRDDEEETDKTGIIYQKKLRGVFFHKYSNFEDSDSVIVMGLDAATTGRLSITYYNEYMARQFFDNILYWGQTCYWMFSKWKNDSYINYIETPSFLNMVRCAFGREKGSYIEVDDRILKEQIQRLVKCMLDRQPIPHNILQALVERASLPLAYSRGNRERVLSTACAVILKYYYDHNLLEKGVDEPMRLDRECTERSYLFGRLLAVYERAEKQTYERDEKRETNAIRLQAAFVHHPMQTWKILEEAVQPYFQGLPPQSREFFKKIIQEITFLLPDDNIDKMNQELKESYLLGYYLQRAELYRAKVNKEEQNNE